MKDFGGVTTRRPRYRGVLLRILLVLVFAAALSALGALVRHLANATPLQSGIMLAILGATPALRHEWHLRRGKHWQIVSSPSENQGTTDAAEGTRGGCGPGMVEVKGQMKMAPSPSAVFDLNSVDELQKTTCTKWITQDYPERCAEFDREKWLSISKELPQKSMHFCVDRFEYPNQKGAYPWIAVSFYEAVALCADEGKRLCDEQEWTFACEGEEATPYPYGYARDPSACTVDKPWRPYNAAAMRPRDGVSAMIELDLHWQGVPSGSQPRCRSPFGVYDMTGNIDEWTRTVRKGERPSILKGGYWGPVRTRCRPSTRAHDENYIFYQEGFRCCTDPGVTPVRKSASDEPSLAPFHPRLR
jgi:formylglycine-generating enzyme required for sulfatase activity